MKVKKRVRQRKCLECGELFTPDPRLKGKQEFCSKPECRCASKAHSQRKWLSKPENREYFCGDENTKRVQKWRKDNPSYAKEAYLRKKALQDTCSSQLVDGQEDVASLMQKTLQDMCLSQPALFVGLIASLSGLTLQDEIAVYIRNIHSHGLAVLAMETTKIGDEYENQEAVITPRAGASSP